MRRKLITAASVVSLLLCVGTAALWARSYVGDQTAWIKDSRVGPPIPDQGRRTMQYAERTIPPRFRHLGASRFWSNTEYELHVYRGRIGLLTIEDWCAPGEIPGPVQWSRIELPRVGFLSQTLAPSRDITKAEYGNAIDRRFASSFGRDIPVWPAVVVTAILPAVFF